MTLKKLILALLTALAISRIYFSLNDSLAQPQIQSRLELYQSNLVLHVSELKSDLDFDLEDVMDSVVGENPYTGAIKQYQKARSEAKISRNTFQEQLQKLASAEIDNNNLPDAKVVLDTGKLDATQEQQKIITKQISEINNFINEIDLKQGILNAVDNKTDKALSLWRDAIARINNPQNSYAQTARVLENLWQQTPQVVDNSEELIKSNLDSWFEYKALEKLYQVSDSQSDLLALRSQEKELAAQSIFKLALISGIPVFGGIAGIILLIFLLVQLLLKKERAVLAINSNKTWQTPWDWEIIWQVLIVGFFFFGQFVLPILLGLLGINPSNSSLRIKALYVFGTYILMAAGGIGVLYFSIKSYLPFPKDWFKFKFLDTWMFWGFGGYLIAIPLVLIVSLINQQIWQGQGGSNPLLFLALQAQDTVALAIFFITASVAAPIFEEIMFRGFLLPSLTRYIPVWGAIVVSGLIFAVAHLSLSEVLPLATLGIILGIVYTRSRNLFAPILLHSLWNSGTLISLFVLGSGS
ncbi:MAG: type II CAAX endopeptidase family protein [Pleurocapsa sp.]